jgi:quercetin dioxygenase-like cupin family protein
MIRQTVTALTGQITLAPRTQWLVHPRLTPGARGLVAVEVLHDDVITSAHFIPTAESVTVLLTGKGTWVGGTDPLLGPGEGAFNPPGTWRGLTPQGSDPTVLLTVYDSGRVQAPEPVNDCPEAHQCGCRIASLLDGCSADRGAVSGTAEGLVDVGVRRLASKDTVGTRSLMVAMSTFAPSGRHELHRHPHADQFFLVLSGRGEHLTQDGPVSLAPGDLVFIRAGEWHGFRADPAITTDVVYGYLGAGSLDQAGYDLQDPTLQDRTLQDRNGQGNKESA